jgi:hypothetical protein
MIPAAKLLYRSNMTYLPSNLPVQYYGLPDGKVHIVYGRFYDAGYGKSGVEYVFAVHREFSYNYNLEKIVPKDFSAFNFPFDNSILDNQNPKINIVNVTRNIHSLSDAFNLLNEKAIEILNNRNQNGRYKFNRKAKQQIESRIA